MKKATSQLWSVDYPSRSNERPRRSIAGVEAIRSVRHDPPMSDQVVHFNQPEPAVAIFQAKMGRHYRLRGLQRFTRHTCQLR